MSELTTLARPYAAAVFKRAKETNTADQWSAALTFMAAVFSDAEMQALVANPRVSRKDLLALALDVCGGQIDQEGVNFLKLLAQNNRLALLPAIAALFEDYKAEAEGYAKVELSTAFEFSEETWFKLVAALEKTFSKKLQINVTVDKSLIGGVLVRAGDRVIDGSIRGQLQQMQKALQ